jgi:hypothetical protein
MGLIEEAEQALDMHLPKGSLFDRFAIWFTQQTPEDRMIRAELARRLKLRNDMQEVRAMEREDRKKRREAGQWVSAAVWRYAGARHQYNDGYEDVILIVRLQESRLTGERRMVVMDAIWSDNGQRCPMDYAEARLFMRSRKAYTDHVLPWIQGLISTDALKRRKVLGMTVHGADLRKKKPKKEAVDAG